MEQHRKNTMAKHGLHLVSCPWLTRVKLCKQVDRTSMMKSREYDETKQMRRSIEEKQKEYGGKARSAPCKVSFANRSESWLVRCPLRTRVKLCKKVDRTSIMKSREYDETKKVVVY